MADHNTSQQKTEAPTPRRLQEARRRGQVARSRDLSSALVLVLGVILLYALRDPSVRALEDCLTEYFNWCVNTDLVAENAYLVIFKLSLSVAGIMAPYFIVLLFVALAANIVQVGFIFAPNAVKPRLERLNPVEGLKRIFGLRGLVELAKSVLKIVVVAAVVFGVLKARLPELLLVYFKTPPQLFQTVTGILLNAVAAGSAAFLAVAFLDLLYQRWEYYRNLRMTRQELKDELKHTEGDPHVKSWLRRRQRQVVMNRIRQEVPRATVVVTNPVHLAVALRYDEGQMAAPRVVAKGAGVLAEMIKEIAHRHGIPVVRDPETAQALYRLDVGVEIPPELYRAVAQIIAMVYRLDRRSRFKSV